jgi:hypothetical protein
MLTGQSGWKPARQHVQKIDRSMKMHTCFALCILLLTSFLAPAGLQAQTPGTVGLDFDGVDDIVTTTYPGVLGNAPRTVEAWIKTTANANPNNNGIQQIITDWGTFATGARFTFCVLWNNAIRLEVSGSGVSGNIAVNDGNWHHVAGVYNPSASNTISLYVDGVLDVSGNLTVGVNTQASVNLQIGERIDGARQFDGVIDEVRVWNVARSQSDLMTYMSTELCSIPPALTAYYNFNDGVANSVNSAQTSLRDLSGNNNDGTLSNFTLSGTSSNFVPGASLTAGANREDIAITACDSFLWNDNNTLYTQSGTYSAFLTNLNGCDSLVNMDLTIETGGISTTQITACDSYFWAADNNTYTQSGIYTTTVTVPGDCDSTLNLDLTINNSTSSTDTVLTCDPYFWIVSGSTYVATGVYSITIPNSVGCDSIVGLDLTIFPSDTSTETVSSCGSFFWPANGTSYTQSGNYSALLTNVNGCDSLAQLNLTVTPVDTNVTNNGLAGLSAVQSGGSYQWLDCDNGLMPIPGATQQSYLPPQNGNFAVEVTLGSCVDTSGCQFANVVGLEGAYGETISLSPNPNQGSFLLRMERMHDRMDLSIRDIMGKVLHRETVRGKKAVQLETDLPAGMYFLQVTTSEGEVRVHRFVVER